MDAPAVVALEVAVDVKLHNPIHYRSMIMRIKRQGIIIWFQHKKNLKHIKRYGHLIYVSKKLRYAVLYINQDELDETMEELLRFPFISKVIPSYRPFLKTDFENALPDKAKQYDYKVGI